MNILVGYKGVSFGRNLLELSVAHAKAFNATILLASSMKGAEDEDQKKIDDVTRNLEAARDFLDKQGVKCESHMLVHGMEPGEDLLSFAREKEVFEIIIGVRSRSKVGKLIFGSTAQEIILAADCPVVTVRTAEY